ncbi:cytochrome c(L), periplasmic [Pollutimonas bauzanensis]|uniref:Cytochrome cL apoprotein n=1 Tax=Pollutimonas bauzanensis TaxID=658167 RepID=A0A1M5M7S6_9BURK|nr:cytochrome c(L), periplasmic [Pollutimonas bauzanensis]SHG73327.1 cytochrome cL apoprotein [Pollutimonas bauzanensis]
MSKLVSRQAICGRVLKQAVCGMAALLFVSTAWGQMTFRNAVTGEELSLDEGRSEGRDTPAVKAFVQTGVNPYNEDRAVLPKAKELFSTACSGCHGHLGEGKIGPALNHSGWNYQIEEDKGLFEVIYGGATRQMGPQYEMLTQDEMLQIMAWIRHLYTGPAEDAVWLTEEQQKNFKPYKE